MASNPVNTPSAPPGPAADGAKSQTAKAPDRRLRLEDILKLMAADGLVSTAQAEKLARSRTQRFETPLELIADQKWHSLAPPRKVITLDALVEWLAGKLGVQYQHIDPLKIDLVAVTATMSNAYAERYRILPVHVAGGILTVATSEPFVRAWADELEQILHLRIKLVFANPQDIRRFLGEFFNLARSMKKAQETSKGDISLARNFEQLVELGKHGQLDANDQHVVHIVDWLWQYAFEQRASDIHIEPRRDSGVVRFRIDGVLHQVYAIPNPVLIAMTSRIKLLARMEIVEKRRPQDGRIKTVSPDGTRNRAAHLDHADRVRRKGGDAYLYARSAGARLRGARLRRRGSRALGQDDQGALRHHPGHGPDRLGQDDDAVLDDEAARDARGQRLHRSRTRSK